MRAVKVLAVLVLVAAVGSVMCNDAGGEPTKEQLEEKARIERQFEIDKAELGLTAAWILREREEGL